MHIQTSIQHIGVIDIEKAMPSTRQQASTRLLATLLDQQFKPQELRGIKRAWNSQQADKFMAMFTTEMAKLTSE